ncbi:MAG: T9SS type A sorting domain-containing protein [Bacteroidota bacterium]|nr:T9SS type A sorting domain-containing protein [Bacteroidota bacterium]
MSNRNGRAATTGLGSTGAPGDDATVCQSCHNGPIDVKVDITVLDIEGDTVVEYLPDQTYTVKVLVSRISGSTPLAYGFQMVSLNAPLGKTGPDIKSWVPISNFVKLSIGRNQRLYAEQKDRSPINLFELTWTAPQIGSGPVSFYAGGNAVNADNTSSGDGASKTSLELTEGILASNKDSKFQDLAFYPNPFQESVNLLGDIGKVSSVVICDLFGKVIKTEFMNERKKSFLLLGIQDGVYLAQLKDNKGVLLKTLKLVKRGTKA